MNNIGTDLCYFSVSEILSGYRKKSISPVDVIKSVFEKIKECNEYVNAFACFNQELALAAAVSSEKRWMKAEPMGLIDGVPVTLKDLIPVKDWNIRRGAITTDIENLSRIDSPVAARLRENNAIFIGSTTTPEFGWKAVTDSPLMGITRNPWDLSKTPGGSSGGAAVSASLGMGAVHIGSDGGGSLRIPASFTGVFGFKGTAGRVPVYPESILGSMYHIGSITRSVQDTALLLNIISKPDHRDWSALPFDNCDYSHETKLILSNLRIGFSPRLGYANVDPEVASLVKDGVAVLEGIGARIEEIDPGFSSPINCFTILWRSALSHSLKSLSDKQKDVLDPELRDLVNGSSSITLSEYQDAMNDRIELKKIMNGFYNQYDLLITPTLPITAFKVGRLVADNEFQKNWPDWSPFSYPFNLSGEPACSIPCGFTSAGLPVGMQIVAPRYKDHLLIEVAKLFEEQRPFRFPVIGKVSEM